MLKLLTRLGVIAELAILIGSCTTEYTYTPPTTADGRDALRNVR